MGDDDDDQMQKVWGFVWLRLSVCMQLRDVRVKLLYHLFYRPLPGEEVWLVSLAEALGVEYGVLVEQLKVCHIEIARTRGADYILVPGPDFLPDMLSDDGFDTDILDPLEALVDGDFFGIRWMNLYRGVRVLRVFGLPFD